MFTPLNDPQMSAHSLQSHSPREDGSPDDASTNDRKRRRKVLSCFTCRRRKLRCDREYPFCARCQNSGCANSCTYDTPPDPGSATYDRPYPRGGTQINLARATAAMGPRQADSLHTSTSSMLPGIAQAASQRRPQQFEGRLPAREVGSLQVRLARLERAAGTAANDSEPLEEEQPARGTSLFKGKGFKTQFYGATCPMSIVAQFPEFREFMTQRMMQYPAIVNLHRDMKALIIRAKRAKLLQPEPAFTKIAMLDMLPARTTMDRCAVLYFDNFEIIYRVLHEPSFWRDYDVFWKDTEVGNPSFVVILLLVVSIVSTLAAQEPLRFIGKSSSARESAMRMVEACESWFSRQTHKHLTIELIQIQCLMVVAKQMNRMKMKRAWMSAGFLIRFGMSAGLHRDASILGGRVSIFAQEMRKRLWATMVELELQASFDRGMPALSVDLSTHCGPPANIRDSDLEVLAQQAPSSQNVKIWTTTSYSRLSYHSINLRASLNNLINESNGILDYSDMLAYDEKIRVNLGSLPYWQSVEGSITEHLYSPKRDSERQKWTISKTLLDLQLRQFLIPLHAPFAQDAPTNPRHQHSAIVCYETTHKILALHTDLMASGTNVLNLLRDDVLGPALSTCRAVYVSASLKDSLSLQSLGTAFLPDIHKALNFFEEKERRNGAGLQQFWGLSAADALIRTKLAGKLGIDHDQPMNDAVARVMGIYYRIIASQEDPSMAISLHRLDDEPSFAITGAAQGADLGQLDGFRDLSAWAFDDMWNFELDDFRLG